MMRLLIALIALAITVQNTCPYGTTGKTAVVASHVHHCPLKDHHPARREGKDKVGKDFRDLSNPFVLVSASVDRAFGAPAPVRESGVPVYTGFKDIVLSPPLRPPRG